MIASWILDQLFYWWIVSYLLAVYYWHCQGDDVVRSMVGSIFTSPMILAVIVLLLEMADFVIAPHVAFLAAWITGLIHF